jgi:iron complex outermembrane receptor protein
MFASLRKSALPVFVFAFLGALPLNRAGAQNSQKVDASYEIAIPAGKLANAIDRLRAQSGVQIMYEAAVAEGVTVPALNGKFTVRAALTQLLAHTGVRVESADDKTVVLKRAPPSTSNVSPADQMRVALTEEAVKGGKVKDGKDTEEGADVVVEDKRIRPFGDANVDMPRTINDAQPYYIFDAQTIERSGALDVQSFLRQRLSMDTTFQRNSEIFAAEFNSNTVSRD